jgi:hypothetical protein
VVQLTPAMLERHLQGMTETLRSAMAGRVRDAIQQSVARILVGVDGDLTIEAKPKGPLGLGGSLPIFDGRGEEAKTEEQFLSSNGRRWGIVLKLPQQ